MSPVKRLPQAITRPDSRRLLFTRSFAILLKTYHLETSISWSTIGFLG